MATGVSAQVDSMKTSYQAGKETANTVIFLMCIIEPLIGAGVAYFSPSHLWTVVGIDVAAMAVTYLVIQFLFHSRQEEYFNKEMDKLMEAIRDPQFSTQLSALGNLPEQFKDLLYRHYVDIYVTFVTNENAPEVTPREFSSVANHLGSNYSKQAQAVINQYRYVPEKHRERENDTPSA